jgi:uncharacterized membrane protein YdbT with pleckstrin-like domain
MASLAIRKTITQLRDTDLFADLSRTELEALARLVGREKIPSGRVVYRQGDPGRRYFILQEGALRITRVDAEGRVEEVQRVGPGAAFGQTSLLLGDVRDATVETIQPSVLLTIEKDEFDRFIEEHPRAERRLNVRPDIAQRRAYPRFSWLEEDELPVKVLRKHPAVLVTNLALPGGLGLAILVLGLMLGLRQQTWAVTLALILIAPLILICLYLYIDWRNDVYVVTTRRVSHQERIGLIREHRATAPIQAIQNIAQVQIGPLSRLLDYGDLIMEMTGEGGQVIFRSVPHPVQVQALIYDQMNRMRAGQRARQRVAIGSAMRRYFTGEEGNEDRKEEESTQTEVQETTRWQWLTAPIRAFRAIVPPAWHRQGSTITWRKHWVALLQAAGLPLLVVALLTLGAMVIAFAWDDHHWTVALVYAVGMIIFFPWLIWQVVDWQNDYYQVTSTRLIHVDRMPLYLREERRESPLDRITNVRFDQSVVGKILGYGDVFVETAAVAGDFDLRFVKYPQEVQKEIFSHMEAFQRQLQERETERRRAELMDWFSIYDELRGAGSASPEQKEQG